MGRKKMRKRGDIDGVIFSLVTEASSLLATIKLNGCNNGKCVRSAKLLAVVAQDMAKAFEQKMLQKKQSQKQPLENF